MRRAKLDEIRKDLDAVAESLAAELARPEIVPGERPEMVGYGEIAQMLGVTVKLVRTWRQRGRLPESYAELMGGPIWLKAEIDAWLVERAAA